MWKYYNEKSKKEIKVTNFRGSPKVLQISKNNYYYLINREKYDISRIMMMINHDRLSILGEKFHNYPKGLKKIKFTSLLTNILKSEKMQINELTDLIYGIYKFFNEIDYNGDNNMEWAEFTQFIIDNVEGEKNNEIESNFPNKILSDKELIKYKRYELSKKLRDIYIHKTLITSSCYMNKNNKILINEYNTHLIKIYNSLTGIVDNSINIHEINADINNIKFPEIKKELNLNKKYTVINFIATEFIIAVLLSNKLIQFFRTFNLKYNELLFCIKGKSLQKRIWYLENHNMWITSGDKEVDDDYFFINELDINFEFKNGLVIPISNNLDYKNKYCKIFQHKNEIYDVIEIRRPFLILTACLDGLIRLINVKDAEFLKTWKYHPSGVKHLDYNPYLERNGYILSTGFEYNINLYCTDLSLDNAFKGKLEGHILPLVDCKFINRTPICASVDEDGNIRIWDTQLKVCLQSITNLKKNITINGLLILENINKIITFGNNISFYESKYKEEKDNKGEVHEENQPIKICYNKYYQSFYVATLNDIRIYDKNGKIVKTFKKIVENERFDSEPAIRDFIFDCNYRKFYIGFSNGAIIQYNAGNGAEIKIINQIEYTKSNILYYKYHHTKDISKIYFYHSTNDLGEKIDLLFSSSLDSTIQIYDERDYESSIKLRMYRGAHTINEKKCEIICMDFNYHLSQLATGSSNGLIVLWDFEYMKIEDALYLNYKLFKNKLDVLYLKYLNHYPLLFSSYSEGICILWAIKPLESEPIIKFQNTSQILYRLDLCDVTCCCFYDDIIKDFNEEYLNKNFYVEDEYNEENNSKSNNDTSRNNLNPPNINKEIIIKESIIDNNLNPFNNEINEQINTDLSHNNNEEEDNENREHTYYLLICDKKGFIKILNLKGIFNHYIKDIKIKNDVVSNFNILKKENVDSEQAILHLLKESIKKQKQVYEKPYINLYKTRIINKEWKGHSDYITDIEFIDDPISTVTISRDKYLRIWNEKFELIGEINILPKQNILNNLKEKKVEWGFKVNEKKLLEKEIYEIVNILENIKINEETKIIKGSQIDKDFNNPDKYEIDEKEGLIKKKRKKKISEENKDIDSLPKYDLKNNSNEFNYKDDYNNNFQTIYEKILLKNISNKIETIIKNNPKNEGIGEISNSLISHIIDSRNKRNKIMKTFHSKRFKKTHSTIIKKDSIDKKDESIPHTSLSIKKTSFNNSESKSNILNNNKQERDFPSSLKSLSINIDDIKKPLIDKNNLNLNLNINLKENKFSKNKSMGDINYNISLNSQNNNKRFKNIQITNNSKEFSLPMKKQSNKKFNNTMTDLSSIKFGRKNNSLRKLNHCLNRNALYAEKFISSIYYEKNKDKDKEKLDNILPNINSKYFKDNRKKNNININLNYDVKEKTDILIKNQYYLNKYKHLCKINPNNSDFSTNQSNYYNCKNIWNDIKSYTNEILIKRKNRNKRNETLDNFRNIKQLYKSQSMRNLKNKKQK